MNLRDTLMINKNGVLEICGISTVELANKYGTPLYVMDVSYIRRVARAFKDTIEQYGNAGVAFASKSFSCQAMYKIIAKEGLYIDVVSEGEIFTALKAGFDLSKAYFHGNNKSMQEIEYAIDNGIGIIVVDSLDEIEIINDICKRKNKLQKVNFRANPGVEAHTHSFIQTANIDSKFGFSISTGCADKALNKIIKSENLVFNGLNCHIGSQIFDTNAFRLAVDIMTDYIVHINKVFKVSVEELNLGGGFGVHYIESDPKYNIEEYCNYVRVITESLNNAIEIKNIKKPKLMIEPGRSIVGEAGITLYSVGNIKEIPNIKKYVCIDGGMFENIRPALYQAEYEVVLANRALDEKVEKVDVTGKCCESGDVLFKNVSLPQAKRGDIMAVFTTGAYNYSMASNYNRNGIPGVVMVENGQSALAVKPQTMEDINRNDLIPYWLNDKC